LIVVVFFKERYKVMNNYKKCIVAFLDILGFKRLISEKGFDEILEIYKQIINDIDAGIALHHAVDNYDSSPSGITLQKYNEALEDAIIRPMSDSIVVAVPFENPEALAVVIDICNMIQEMFYDMDEPVLLRGGVAVGDFFCDDNIMFGKGLVDAYLAQELYAIYPRIILSNEVTIGMLVSIDNSEDLPMDKDNYWYINTLERYFGIEEYDSWEEVTESTRYDKIKRLIDMHLNNYGDERVRQKYIWLKNELRRIEKKCLLRERTLLLD